MGIIKLKLWNRRRLENLKNMKLFLFASVNALQQSGITKEIWPTSNAYKGNVCGSVTEFTISANQTCTIELSKGKAAFINAGPLLTNGQSDGKIFNVAMATDQADPVRFMTLYENTKLWYRAGKVKYPLIWDLECFTQDDLDNGLTPATVDCTDNDTLNGIYMMGFNTDYSGTGTQNVQVYKSDGFNQGDMLSFDMRNKDNQGVALDNVETPNTNSTVLMGASEGNFAIILDQDYYGQYLQLAFDHVNAPLKPFQMAQAFYSTVTV